MKKNDLGLWLSFISILFVLNVTMIFSADRALLVGVELYNNPQVPSTPGCVEDAEATAKFIQSKYGFSSAAIKLLINEQATVSNITKNIREWLVNGSGPGDRVFFLYAGHGSQLPDNNGDEEDGYDETIAPYDVEPETGDNEIRDDFFNQMIAELSGRRAVFVFDSCHSGTISRALPKLNQFPSGGGCRYLPRPDQFMSLKSSVAGTRGLGGSVAYSVSSAGGRDLKNADEISMIKPSQTGQLSGVVVISAAKANQVAYPIEINGEFRGAFSYVFSQVQKENIPKLKDLQNLINKEINRLRQSGQLEGEQEPVIEVSSAAPLNDYPLFGNWEQAPAVALDNPLSSIRISLDTVEGKNLYHDGEFISYRVNISVSGYLYLIVFSQQNIATCIFPNACDSNNRISRGTFIIKSIGECEIKVGEPFGRDITVAVLAKERKNIGDKQEYSWQEIYEQLNLKELQKLVSEKSTYGKKVKKTGTVPTLLEWKAASLAIETRNKKEKD